MSVLGPNASAGTPAPPVKFLGKKGPDLFAWLDAMWTKNNMLEGKPPTFVMHRFLASNPDFAVACRELQRDVREPELLLAVWQGLLPLARGAPRGLQYVVAKKPPEAEDLVLRMMDVLHESRTVVEEMIEIVSACKKLPQLYREFGIEE